MIKDGRLLSISEAAAELGCSAGWLRLAERLEAVPPARRTPGGQRRYTLGDVEQLREMGVGQGRRESSTTEVEGE